jgi:hypothetical protein
MATGAFPGVKIGRGVTLTPHPLLVLWSRKSRAIPLLPLWAVLPVQSLSARIRVQFTFTFTFTGELSNLAYCRRVLHATCLQTHLPTVMPFWQFQNSCPVFVASEIQKREGHELIKSS